MITSLPHIKDSKGNAGESSLRLRDRRKLVGKVFPKNPIQEEVDEKLDLFCVGLEKDKDSSLPTVELDFEEGQACTTFKSGDGSEVILPGLPSIHGVRRGVHTPNSSPEPVDLLVKGKAQRKSKTQTPLETITEVTESAAVKAMRSSLEPLIDSLFEEDEFFAQDFEENGLNRVLFIRKMGIYVEIKSKDYIPGVLCTPLFHCPRCRDNWTSFGKVPESCPFPRQLTRAPAIHMASNRKPRFDFRNRRTKRRLGDIKEGFVVSESGTVLNNMDETFSGENLESACSANEAPDNGISRDCVTSDAAFETLNLREIDSQVMREAFNDFTEGETAKSVAEALGIDEEQYNDFARVENSDSTDEKPGGLRAVLDSLTVNDLPDSIKAKLLSILKAQKTRNLARSGKKAVENGFGAIDGNSRQGNAPLNESDSSGTKTSRKINMQGIRSRGKRNRESSSSGRYRTSRNASAVGRKISSMLNSTPMDSDDDEVFQSPSASSSDVLAYKELQKQRRARKKNAAVKNRSGQPDTPYQRLGRHAATASSNSMIFGFDNGDSDEEIWRQSRAGRIGSSRAQVSDSRTSMLRKYSRVLGSANVSFSSLDDQMSYSSMGNVESYSDFSGNSNVPIGERRRRPTVKKERKSDANKRPGRYHSKVIEDMALSQATSSKDDVTMSRSKVHVNYAPDDKMSLGRMSLTDTRRHSLSRESSTVMKRFLRSDSFSTGGRSSAKESRKSLTRPVEVQSSDGVQEPYPIQTVETQIQPEVVDGVSTKPSADESSTEHAQDKEASKPKPAKLLKRASQAKTKLFFSVDDFNAVQRLPISSAFTYSFYKLPSQHKEENEAIKQAVSRIGQRKKARNPDHFRSRSAP